MESNVYLEARREWDERYADLVLGKRNWQIAAGGLLVLGLILASGMVWLSERSRYIPSVVEVDKLGYALTVPQPLTPVALPDVTARMERYEIAAFIRDARSVTSDAQVEHQTLNALLARTRGAADRFLDEYYHSDNFSHNPFKVAEKQTVSVQIDSILQLSPRSYQVRWTEQQRDLNGVAIGSPSHWEAALETEIVSPSSDEAIVSNPLGFCVTQILDRTARLGRQTIRVGGRPMRRIVMTGAFALALTLDACAAKQSPTPTPPPLNLVTEAEPKAEAPPALPTPAQILAAQPPEVRQAIKEHDKSGDWAIYRTPGYTLYPYNQGPPPTVDCEPLRTSDIQLQPGETITDVAIGDSERWMATPASSSSPGGSGIGAEGPPIFHPVGE
jgi:type IV secretion system protein VirB5